MAGNEFLNSLQCCGLNSDNVYMLSVDWMLDSEHLLLFFEWFHKELQSSNVLDIMELEEFHKLEADENEGFVILDGDQLAEALSCLAVLEHTDLTLDDFNVLRDHLHAVNMSKDQLHSVSSRLLFCHATVVERITLLLGIANTAEIHLKYITECMHFNTVQMNKAMESLATSVSEMMTEYYSSSPFCESHRDLHIFLSEFKMDEIQMSEEYFTQHLVNFTKKKFFEGIAKIPGHVSGDDCAFLEITDPQLLLVKGACDDTVLSACKELSYTQLFYPYILSRWIDALAKEGSLSAACVCKETLVRQYSMNLAYPADISTLRAKLMSIELALMIGERDVVQLTDVFLPAQVGDASTLQVVRVLIGDYIVKIARQDYFTHNQDQVIHELLLQRSRNEFVTIALEIESRWLHHLHKILMAILLMLQQSYYLLQKRMAMIFDLRKQLSCIDRATVSLCDCFVDHLHSTLDNNDPHYLHAIFATFEEVEHKVEFLSDQLADSNGSCKTICHLRDDKLQILIDELHKNYALISAEPSEAGLLLLSPWSVINAMNGLDSLLKKLEQAVFGVIKDVESKKKLLQKDSLVHMEQELFSYFFNTSNQLRQLIANINSRFHSNFSV